jgi:hypothetical protein
MPAMINKISRWVSWFDSGASVFMELQCAAIYNHATSTRQVFIAP